MAINQLIAQGVRPIGADLPAIGQMLQQRKDAEQRNKLAELAAQTDAKNAEIYGQSLQAQKAAREAAMREQEGTRAREWLTNAVTSVRQNPALIPVLVREGKSRGILTPETPDALTPEQVEEFALANGIAPPAPKPAQYETQRIPGGGILQRDPVTGKLTQVVAPRAPAGGAVAPTKPNWTKIERPLGDGRVEVGVIDMNAPNPESTFRAVGKPTTPGNQQPGNVTEGERKVAALGVRLEGALRTLNSLATVDPDAAKPGLLERGAEAVLGETAANAVRSSNRQQADAAQLDALDAALTLATGAAYTAEQLKNLRKSYFPQIGDSDATKRAKELRFKTVVESARVAAGRAEPNINAALDRAGAATPAAGGWSIQEIP